MLLARNNGNGTFSDITAEAGLTMQTTVVAVAPTDYDNRRDIDIVVLLEDATADASAQHARRDVSRCSR